MSRWSGKMFEGKHTMDDSNYNQFFQNEFSATFEVNTGSRYNPSLNDISVPSFESRTKLEK